MAKNFGLGKGLDSLIPNVSSEVEQEEQISLADMLAKDDIEEPVNEDVEEVESVEEQTEVIDENESVTEEEPAVDKAEIVEDKKSEDNYTEEEEEQEEQVDEKVEEVEEKDDEILVEEETSKASEESTEIKEETIKNIEDNEESIKNIDYTTKENDVDVLLSKKDEENVCQVIEIVESNPRITLWSARSAAVLRYLRKTEPEFSISNEASKLIEEALAEKYPEIWTLFDHL